MGVGVAEGIAEDVGRLKVYAWQMHGTTATGDKVRPTVVNESSQVSPTVSVLIIDSR